MQINRVEQIARVAHEANRIIQIVTADPSPSPAWEDAPQWQRDSAIDGVDKALEGATPEQLHESWVEFKESDGWVYGPVKDVDAKTHPCLVAYEDLPPFQRAKDDLFSLIVRALTEGN